jgi:dTDP-4-dehydrorhamnose 3,5-epimerase
MSERFAFIHEPLRALRVFERLPAADDRGFLERLFDKECPIGGVDMAQVAQVNRTRTNDVGTVRGMHFQRVPFAEVKLVHCVRGAVFDVVVDLRDGSSTFLHWHGEVLSEGNRRCMRIPEGFAHGFQVLEPQSELIYVHSEPYRPVHEDGLRPTDSALAIAWPLPVAMMSQRDGSRALLDASFKGVVE